MCSMRSGRASTFPTVLSSALVPGGIRRWTVTDLLNKRIMVKDEALWLGAQHRSALFPWYLNVVQEWTGNGLPLNAHSGHGTVQNRSASMCDTAQAWRLSVRGPCFLIAEGTAHTWFWLEGPGSGRREADCLLVLHTVSPQTPSKDFLNTVSHVFGFQ